MDFNKPANWILIGLAVIIMICVGKYFYLQSILPDIDTTKLLQRNNVNESPNRKFIPLGRIPIVLRNATIAIEDKDFFNIDTKCSVLGQLFLCTDNEKTCKYSPHKLTQQIVKNVFQDAGTYRLETLIFLPCEIENNLSRDEILQLFLNESQYSSVSYGVAAASKELFKKDVEELNLAESTILAVLPQTPLLYSPIGKNRDQLVAKQVYLLNLMVDQGFITKEVAEAAKNMRLSL